MLLRERARVMVRERVQEVVFPPKVLRTNPKNPNPNHPSVREKCPFKHDGSSASSSHPKASPKPKAVPAVAKAGLVALLATTVAAATATPVLQGPSNHFMILLGILVLENG